MKKQILFIQGAGEGAYKEDEKLANYLQDALGSEYHVLYPLSKELNSLDGKVILVGHSARSAERPSLSAWSCWNVGQALKDYLPTTASISGQPTSPEIIRQLTG
jgi:hypothetical protein